MLVASVVFSLYSITARADELGPAREPAAACGEEPGTRDKLSVESINERYDDFFRMRREAEARARARDAGRAGLRDREDARTRDLELARREYIRTRRPKPDTDAAEAAWEHGQKQKVARAEDARRCYVARKTQAERATARGRRIPADAEFGLDE